MKKRAGFIFLEFATTLPLLVAITVIITVALATYTRTHSAVRKQLTSLDRAQQVLLDLQAGRLDVATLPVDVKVESLASPQPQLKWVRVSVGPSISLIGAFPAEVSR
jgi:hypothetical protein